MKISDHTHKSPVERRFTAPLIFSASALVAAAGFVHLREWLNTYRHIPASAPGAAVVRVGFPVNAAISAGLVLALLATIFFVRRIAPLIIAGAVAFEAASLAILIASRTGTVFGWAEPFRTRGVDQSLALEIGALVVLMATMGVRTLQNRRQLIPVRVPVER